MDDRNAPPALPRVVSLEIRSWADTPDAALQARAADALESGAVLFFPGLPFEVAPDEQGFISPAFADGKAKNISYSIATGMLKGAAGSDAEQQRIRAMLDRYARASRALVDALLPGYCAGLRQARTSFRPVEISGRAPASWRKDDTRLHVDAFPATPTGGERILRVFSNVNPDGAGRHWRLGAPFEEVARRFLPGIRAPRPGEAWLLRALRVTRRPRTAYDHYMLHLHDAMKADLDYQRTVAQEAFTFPAGSSWMVYTDQASHAAMAGQHAFEQTFHLPVAAMTHEVRAPLRVLERLTARPLV